MCDSLVALKKKEENKKKPWSRALSPDKVLEAARQAVLRQGEDPSNKKYVLGLHKMQFGVFKGQTFKWVAENALGYAGYLVASMRRESADIKDSKNHHANKAAFAEYIGLFPEGREAIRIKTENMGYPSSQHMSQQKSPSAPQSLPSVSSVRSLLIGKTRHPQSIDKAVKKMVMPPVAKPGKQSL